MNSCFNKRKTETPPTNIIIIDNNSTDNNDADNNTSASTTTETNTNTAATTNTGASTTATTDTSSTSATDRNICLDEEEKFEQTLTKIKIKKILDYTLTPIKEKLSKKSFFAKHKSDDDLAYELYNGYRTLAYCRHMSPEKKEQEEQDNKQTTGGSSFDYVSFSFELEHAIFLYNKEYAKKEFYRAFFIPDWIAINKIIKSISSNKAKEVYEKIEEDRLSWIKQLKQNPNEIPFINEDLKIENFEHFEEAENKTVKFKKPDPRTPRGTSGGKLYDDRRFFHPLPLSIESIHWGDLHSAVGKRVEWTLTPKGQMSFPANVDFFYNNYLKVIYKFIDRSYTEKNTEIVDFSRLQTHVVFKLSKQEQLAKLLKIINIWNTEKYFRLLTAGYSHNKPWQAKSKGNYADVFHIPWSDGYSESAILEFGKESDSLERSMDQDATIYKFHHIGLRRKYRDGLSPSSLKEAEPDRDLWGLEFRTGSYGPKIMKLQAEATIKMLQMADEDIEKLLPEMSDDYNKINQRIYKAWKHCNHYNCRSQHRAEVSYDSINNRPSERKIFEDFVDAHFEVGFRKWENLFDNDLIKKLIKEERENLNQCLVNLFDKKEDQAFRDSVIFGLSSLKPCMRVWAKKIEDHIKSDKSRPLSHNFPLIGIDKAKTRSIKEALKTYDSKAYKEGTSMNDLRNLLLPMANPYFFHRK